MHIEGHGFNLASLLSCLALAVQLRAAPCSMRRAQSSAQARKRLRRSQELSGTTVVAKQTIYLQ